MPGFAAVVVVVGAGAVAPGAAVVATVARRILMSLKPLIGCHCRGTCSNPLNPLICCMTMAC